MLIITDHLFIIDIHPFRNRVRFLIQQSTKICLNFVGQVVYLTSLARALISYLVVAGHSFMVGTLVVYEILLLLLDNFLICVFWIHSVVWAAKHDLGFTLQASPYILTTLMLALFTKKRRIVNGRSSSVNCCRKAH